MSITELKDKLRALDEATPDSASFYDATEIYAMTRVIEAARRLAEQAGEPVAWQMRSSPAALEGWSRWSDFDSQAHMDAAREVWEYRGLYIETRVLYTTPPSADALVEALGKLSAEWRDCKKTRVEYQVGWDDGRDSCADALDALIAKHKENSR